MHFQDIISTLNRFWAAQGSAVQPYDTEKGAGTMVLTRCFAPLVRSPGR